MKIESSSIAMAAASTASSQRTVRETLRTWIGTNRPDFEGNSQPSAPGSTIVELSDAAKAAQSADTQSVSDAAGTVDNDPKMQLLRLLIEMLTGKKISVLDPQALSRISSAELPPSGQTQAAAATPAARAGFGVEYDRQETYSESASMSFAASGTIRTSDGQDIRFDLSLTMQRSYSEQSSVSVRAGDARKVDPLVINYSGTAAQLSDQAFSFDLNADGTNENIRFVQGGGFLALDRNGDGQINDGSELFGPASGNGFAELQALDTDGNHWIDEKRRCLWPIAPLEQGCSRSGYAGQPETAQCRCHLSRQRQFAVRTQGCAKHPARASARQRRVAVGKRAGRQHSANRSGDQQPAGGSV